MKKVLLSTALLVCMCSTNVFAQNASEKSVMTLMEKTGVTKMINTMFNQMKVAYSGNEKAKKAFDEVVKELDVKEYIKRVVPVYQKYYTQEDIDALNKFYDTPVGQKVIRVQPQLLTDVMQVGREWTQETIQKIQAKKTK